MVTRRDAPTDRSHPKKCKRPIPSGEVSVPIAYLEWLVVGAAGLGITLFVRDVVRVMADYAFRDAWVVVPILILAYFLQACTDFFNFGIYHAGKSKHMAFGTGLAAIVILGLSFWWIPIYGAAGAAWATLVAFSVRLGYVYVASQRVCPIDYRLGRSKALVVCEGPVVPGTGLEPARREDGGS